MSTELIPSPTPRPVFQVALFTPTPKAAKRVLEFFTAQIDNDNARKAYLNATRRACGEGRCGMQVLAAARAFRYRRRI
jgi:hypothetical protein